MTGKNPNTIAWFEVPVDDMGRASQFYETIFSISLHKTEMEDIKMAIFPSGGEPNNFNVHGALVEGDGYIPGEDGPILYFAAGDDLLVVLNKVEKAGGEILMKKTAIGEHGFCAQFLDTEGNRVALHSMK